MSKTSEKMDRWSFLDSLLARQVPVSQIEIMEAYQANPKFSLIREDIYGKKRTPAERRDALESAYLATLRKDLSTFKAALQRNGMQDMLLVSRGAEDKQWEDGKDMRTKMFRYRNPDFSIIPYLTREMSDSEYRSLVRAVGKLKTVLPEQIYDNVRFSVLSRIESDYDKGINCVEYEDNRRLKGREFRPVFYKAIQEKRILHIRYRSFKGAFFEFDFHPYLLKQYNERWFVFGLRPDKRNPYSNVPLDRLEAAPIDVGSYAEAIPENYSGFFSDIVGVTKIQGVQKEHILLGVHDVDAWGRITTKPFPTQQIVKEFDAVDSYGQLALDIIPNEEFFSRLLSCGKYINIEFPDNVKDRMKENLNQITELYR